MDHFRSLKNKSDYSESYFESIPDESEAEARKKSADYETTKLAACIIPFMNRLPPIYKEALTLTEFKNYSQLELAEHLGISYSGAKSRVQRAKIKLKELFENCCNISSSVPLPQNKLKIFTNG